MKTLALLLGLLLLAGGAQAQSPIIPAAKASVAITGTVATATQIVAAKTNQSIYITSLALVPADTSVVTFTAGTGTNCGTGTVTLASWTSVGQTIAYGTGYGALIVAPKGAALCITIATAVSPGVLSYDQF